MTYIWTISFVAALGGLLFGYDWVVIGGAKPFFERYFQLTSSFEKGWANSCALVGCLIGAIVSGALSDRFGRQRLLVLSGILFLATGLGTATAQTFSCFILFRVLGGMGIGLASNISPMYIAEIAPSETRGKLVSVYQLAIVIGILLAQLVNWRIAEAVPVGASDLEILRSWNGQYGWRWMFGAGTAPALGFFLAALMVPESPRWLVQNARDDEARKVLGKIGGIQFAEYELSQIKETLIGTGDQARLQTLLEPAMLKILLLGVTLAVLQQWCGINMIFSYAEEIFGAGGYGIDQILLSIVATGVVNLAFTFVAIYAVDRLGRRKLLLLGEGGLAVTYAVLGLCLMVGVQGPYILMLAVIAIACYASTLAPVVWVVISEIFPNRIRGAATSVAVCALWTACFIMTYTFPTLNATLGASETFWMYGFFCIVGFAFIWRCLPETRGRSLEQIERAFSHGGLAEKPQ